jgi:hypothetical protein
MTVQQKTGLVAALRDAAGQLVAQNLSKYTEYVAINPIAANGPVMEADVKRSERRQKICTRYLLVDTDSRSPISQAGVRQNGKPG